MAESVATRYAAALFSLAIEENNLLAYQNAMKELSDLFKDNPKMLSILSSEFLSLKEKEDIAEKIASIFSLSNLGNFMKVLISHHRINQFCKIQREFNILANEKQNIEEGIVYSAKPLSKAQLEKIEKSIKESIGRDIELYNKIDQTLIGGVKVVIHDRVYDGSLKNKISLLKNELLGG